MRRLAILLFVNCVTFGAAAIAASADPYDPIALNERAAISVRAGDYRTAWILLERAARLAPHDGRIRANLDAVRAQLNQPVVDEKDVSENRDAR